MKNFSVYEILEILASNNGKKFKEQKLHEFSNNKTLQKALYLAYNPTTQFYIRKIPSFTSSDKSQISLDEALDSLQKLSNREVTGNAASQFLKELLEKLDKNDGIVIQRVINKDLKCGINATTINKIFGKGFIKETPYMGAISYNKKKVKKLFEESSEVVSEIKMDGRYIKSRRL